MHLARCESFLFKIKFIHFRLGLRTLVFAKKVLTLQQYEEFERNYEAARASVVNRSQQVASVIQNLERDMQLLCLTGVEDSLQAEVQQTLELLTNAGIKIWMLTGRMFKT